MLLPRCTKMVNRQSYLKRYMGNQATCELTDTGTDQATGDPCPCHIHPKCHKICCSGKYAKLNEMIDTLQRSNEYLNRLFNITEVLTQCIRY